MSVTIRFEDGDFQIGSTGGQTVIGGAEKAAQDTLFEVLLPYEIETDSGNEMYAKDGSFQPITSSFVTGPAAMRSYFRNAVGRLMAKQAQSDRTSQSERIREINNVVAFSPLEDPTVVKFLIEETLEDGPLQLVRAIQMRHLKDDE